MMLKQKAKKGFALVLIFVFPLLYIAGYGLNVFAASAEPVFYNHANDKDLPSPPKGLPSVKFDDNEISGVQEKSKDGMTVTATFHENDYEVSFVSNTPVAYVFVKGGN